RPRRATIRREGVVDVLLALTVGRHVLRLGPGVVEVAACVDRHLDEDIPRINSVRQIGDFHACPGRAAVDGLCDVELPCAWALESLATHTRATDKGNVDVVRGRPCRSAILVRYDRAGHPQPTVRRVGT